MMRLFIKIKELLLSERFGLAIVFISFGFLFLTIIVFIIFGNWNFSTVLSEEKIAQFGDFVGGVIGTLLAFAASILYYIALKEQQKDVRINRESLSKQIEEFSNQVEELQLSRKVYEEQQKTMRLQQFETNFYSYFEIYLKVKNELINQKEGNYFKKVIQQVSSKSKYKDISTLPMHECYNHVKKMYFDYFISNRKDYDHYFRCLYRLLSIVTDAFENDIDRMKYIKIIRSQLTDYELLVLYYNTHSDYANKSRNLIFAYNILKHLPVFDKIEINNRYRITPKSKSIITSFYDFFVTHFTVFVNSVCDSPDTDECQFEYLPLKCLIKLSVQETDIAITILYKDRRIVPDNFDKILSDLLYDILFISTFNILQAPISKNDIQDEFTGYLGTVYSIQTDKIKKIIIDLDDNNGKQRVYTSF